MGFRATDTCLAGASRRRIIAAAGIAAAGLAVAAPVAGGVEVPGLPSPLSVISTAPPPACPTPNEITGAADSAALARFLRSRAHLRGNEARQGTAYLAHAGFLSLQNATAYVVAVCDPAIVPSGRTLPSLTGAAATPPTEEIVGAGFRARTTYEPRTSRAAVAAIGDRWVLPVVSARAIVDVVADTAGGASAVRLGPFAAAPLAVSVQGTLQAPVVVTELAGGGTLRTPVPVPAAARFAVRSSIDGQTLRLKIRTSPGSWVSAAPPEANTGSDDVPGFGEDGTVKAVDAAGRATLVFDATASRPPVVLVGIANTVRRTASSLRCRLKWTRFALRRAKCAPLPAAAAQAQAQARPAPTPAAPAAAAAATHRAGTARAMRLATASVPIVGIDASTVAHMTDYPGATGAQIGSGEFLFGDVTADGRPDFTLPSRTDRNVLLVSQGPSWHEIPFEAGDESPAYEAVPDLTGDGIGDLEAMESQRVIAGHREWSTSPPASLDLRPSVLTGADFGFNGGRDLSDAYNAYPELVLPDLTGDGRAELGIITNGVVTTWASEELPLGRRTSLPNVRDVAPGDLGPALSAIARNDGDAGRGTGGGDQFAAVSGQAFVRAADAPNGIVSIRPLVAGPPPALGAPTRPLAVAGKEAEFRDVDRTTGERLLVSTGEACTKRGCLIQVRRLAADGGLIATAILRSRSTNEIQASFLDDGPDADALPEVVIHENHNAQDGASDRRPETAPGLSGTMALWASSAGSVQLAALPVLGAGGAPLLADGPLQTWAAPSGERFIAAIIRAGGAFDLTLLGRLTT